MVLLGLFELDPRAVEPLDRELRAATEIVQPAVGLRESRVDLPDLRSLVAYLPPAIGEITSTGPLIGKPRRDEYDPDATSTQNEIAPTRRRSMKPDTGLPPEVTRHERAITKSNHCRHCENKGNRSVAPPRPATMPLRIAS